MPKACCAPSRPPHPTPTHRDVREAPLVSEAGCGEETMDFGKFKVEYFSLRIWTAQISLIARANFVFARAAADARPAPEGIDGEASLLVGQINLAAAQRIPRDAQQRAQRKAGLHSDPLSCRTSEAGRCAGIGAFARPRTDTTGRGEPRCINARASNMALGLWVPAFAGTTLILSNERPDTTTISQRRERSARRCERQPVRDAALGKPIRPPQHSPCGEIHRGLAPFHSTGLDLRQIVQVQPAPRDPPELAGDVSIPPSLELDDAQQRIRKNGRRPPASRRVRPGAGRSTAESDCGRCRSHRCGHNCAWSSLRRPDPGCHPAAETHSPRRDRD